MLWVWQPIGLLVTLALVGVTMACATLARRARGGRPGRYIALGVCCLVGTLFVFKYAPWLMSLTGVGVKPAAWVVPLGLSFTVFRLIGVLVDSHALQTTVGVGDVLLLSLFFPTFRSGPITSPARQSASPNILNTRMAFTRIATGLFRKYVLADPLHALLITPWLAGGVAHLTPWQAVLLPALFGFFIYWDFAGYCDLAVGIGSLLGYPVPENFDRPYLSANLLEFWRRWHITLSEWIRTRLMMKMMGRRSPKAHVYAVIVFSMTLCGLWHGAGPNFIVWCLWHRVGIVAVHLFGERSAQRASSGEAWLKSLHRHGPRYFCVRQRRLVFPACHDAVTCSGRRLACRQRVGRGAGGRWPPRLPLVEAWLTAVSTRRLRRGAGHRCGAAAAWRRHVLAVSSRRSKSRLCTV